MNTFEYSYEMQATGQLDIEDIGNCAIVGYNSRQYIKYILIVKTVDGETKVVVSGPHWVELETPCVDYAYTYQSFQFNEGKISKAIEKFLNGRYCVDQAQEVSFKEAINLIPDVRKYLDDK